MVLVWWRKRREVAAAFPAPCGGCCYGARRLQSTSSARPPRHSQCVPRVTAVEGRGPRTAAPLHHKTERLTAGVSVIFRPHQRKTWRGACEGSCQLWRWGPKTQKWRKRVRRRRRVMSHPIKSTKLQLCRPASRKRWKQIRNQKRGIVIFTSDGSGRIWPSNWIKLISIEPLDWESEAAFSSNLVQIWIMNRQLFLSFWKDANWKLIWKCKYWVIWYARAVEHLCKTWWSIFFSTAKYLFNTCRDIFMFRTQFHDTWCSLNFVKHKLHFQVLLYYHL